MRRRQFLTACLSTVGSGCSRGRRSAPRKLTVVASKQLSMSSLYLTQELGFFREAGLEVGIIPSVNSLQSLAALTGGKLDALFTSIQISILNLAVKGAAVKIVAGREIASPVCGAMGVIYALRRTFPKGLADLRQLKGKRVVTGSSIGLSQFALDAHLASVGLSAEDVSPVILSSPQGIAALFGGSVDAIVLNNEVDRDLMSLSSEVVHSEGLASFCPNFQCSHILFGPALIEADVDVGARFLAAYLRGAREFAAGKTPRFMREYARTNRLDVKLVTSACRNTFTPDGEVDMKSLKLFTEWAARRKYTPTLVDASQLVDLRFLRRARAS
jgi:NitT/TauT family transport system substrate-binding protein